MVGGGDFFTRVDVCKLETGKGSVAVSPDSALCNISHFYKHILVTCFHNY